MTRQEIVDLVDDYLKKALEPGISADCAAHLAHCVDCRNFFASYRGTIRLAAGAHSHAGCSLGRALPERLEHAILAARLRDRT